MRCLSGTIFSCGLTPNERQQFFVLNGQMEAGPSHRLSFMALGEYRRSTDILAPSSSNFLYLFPSPALHLPISPSASQLGETHMGDLPAGMPAPVPNHGALTLPPSVSASPVCCRFANRTIQMVSSLLPLWPPTLATSEGQRDSLRDLWFFTVYHAAPRWVHSHPWVGFLVRCCCSDQ